MEFHVSRQARDRYQFDEAIYALSGNVIFANFQAARTFAQKINQKRDIVNHPERAARSGEINAVGLIDEILHYVIALYREQRSPQLMAEALNWLKERIGARDVERTLVLFATEFPPLAVYKGEISLAEYYEGSTDGVPNEQVLLEEMLMLWVANKNTALASYQELFDDERLSSETSYSPIMAELHQFMETQPKFGPENQNLIDMLRAPAVEVPYSLFGQLEYIRDRWAELLGRYLSHLLRRLLSSMDLIREEQKTGFMGPGPIEVPVFDAATREFEAENFSPDRDWMPRLVLIAKNTFVWLDQLSQAYNRRITRLDEIPDEELEKLAHQGFTGLWLIGLWERSRASARIKQLTGNPEAIASAYSLYDYRIAGELGGEEAYNGLRDKAWRYGIRLASDMVPNHMGIDSPWVVEHPDWFLSLDYSPYPSYSFSGPDLSDDDRVSILLEDHYYTRTDAAVVFKHIDKRGERERYIYHGNDGTSMPWNDTAQLNYLKPEVREAIIQTILAVARRFPIIRFDAAMTLAKLHYQRLWFPQPGTGGAIPSRADHGMSKEQFDQAMPVEFWREVVERVAQEAPDTLLLAEAFWMMEGFFVRTLGMHRVYNSAFMNILRNEDNAKYRLIMKNILEFDPEILKRYVNFMNNPDERTAVDQFGKGDKYFGICTLMATMPGLPMFGHGQIEGFSEKYGMEFKRAYWNEEPDQDLIDRHQREIFPLLHRRALFAGVENFLLYDLFTSEGAVNEDVFVYSNGLGNERSLVVYNNKFNDTQGWIHSSVGYTVKTAGGERQMVQRTLGEGLNLHPDPRGYCIFHDVTTGLEYIRSSQEIIEKGLFISLHAYEYHVFLDFREVIDDDWGSYRRVHEYLAGRGVPSVQTAMQDLLLEPVLQPLREIINAGYFRYLIDSRLTEPGDELPERLIDEACVKMSFLLDGIQRFSGQVENRDRLIREMRVCLRLALSILVLDERYPLPTARKYQQALRYLAEGQGTRGEPDWILLFGWVFLHNLGKLSGAEDYKMVTNAWINEWQFGRVLDETARELGIKPEHAMTLSSVLRILIEQQDWFDAAAGLEPKELLKAWLSDADIQRYLEFNRFEDVVWFNRERFENFVWWMVVLAVMGAVSGQKTGASMLVERLLMAYSLAQTLLKAEQKSGYQVAKLLEAV